MRKNLLSPACGAALVVCLSSLVPMVASADGMFFTARGARPLGRAGAYTAGADDLEAIYYNPAGLSGTGDISAMLDVGLVFQSVDYTRIDSGGNTQPTVSDNNGIIPIPLLGVSWRPEALSRRLTFAFAAFAPYSGVANYDPNGPQRYSLVSINGTALLVAELAVSFRITPTFYLAAGFQNMFASVHNVVTLSGCTALNCAPEDPNFDAPAQARVASQFTPSGNFGALYLNRWFRVGASFQLPYYIHATGTITTRLPNDHQFDTAVVVGNDLNVDFTIPWVARGGVEVRPRRDLRIELQGDYEAWSMQDKFNFTPVNVSLQHVTGVGTYNLGPMYLNRGMQDAYGVSLGGELDVLDKRLTIRAGYRYESSAVPDATLSVLTPDGDKHLFSVGLSARLGKFRFDLGFGHVYQPDRDITNSQSYQLQPIRPPVLIGVGNGHYSVGMEVLSLGVEHRW